MRLRCIGRIAADQERRHITVGTGAVTHSVGGAGVSAR